MKSVLISIQPYYVFLIIAKAMGWDIGQEKTVEVRKNYPKADDWDKTVKIYCSKNKKSFARIPKEYQPLMQPLLGKVIGEFVCNQIDTYDDDTIHAFSHEDYSKWNDFDLYNSCIHPEDFELYANDNWLYGWHISDLVIYDKPKELSEFKKINRECWYADLGLAKRDCPECKNKGCFFTRPPQSWCYVERSDNNAE